MKNSVDLRDYKLIIEMIGDTYFGELNLDMVTLTNGNVSYPLDIVSVTGFSVVNRTKTSPGEYKIECGFEDDLEEVKSIFSMDDDFDLDQNVASL